MKPGWTNKQISMLRKEFPVATDLDKLATRIKKTRCAVRSKATVLGIRR